MNPLTNTKNQNLMNERELRLGYTGTLSSWHRQYKDSAWIFIGGLNYELTEGDVICVFSQYGEVVNINMVRDKKTGVSKGFAFLCYEDQRSTVLATDNLNGVRIAGRVIRVDHVDQYKIPKEGTIDVSTESDNKKSSKKLSNTDDVAAYVREHGCAPEVMKKLEEIRRKQIEKDQEFIRQAETRKHRPERHRPRDDRHHRPRVKEDHLSSPERCMTDRSCRNRSPPSHPSERLPSPPARIKEEPLSPPRRLRPLSRSRSPNPRKQSYHK